jgi:hypothetical protein
MVINVSLLCHRFKLARLYYIYFPMGCYGRDDQDIQDDLPLTEAQRKRKSMLSVYTKSRSLIQSVLAGIDGY